MKANKFFRVLAGLLSLILAIALLGATASMFLLHYSTPIQDKLSDIIYLTWLFDGLEALGAELNSIPFLAFLSTLESWLVVSLVLFALPALLLIIAAAILFSRQKRGKGKFVFATILAMLALVIFVGITEYYAETLLYQFKNPYENDLFILICRIGVGAYAALLILFLILGVIGKSKTVEAAKEAEAPVEAADTTENIDTESVEQLSQNIGLEDYDDQTVQPASVASGEEPFVQQNAEPAKTWDEEYVSAATAHAEQLEYVPEDAKRTTSDVLEQTYQQTVNLSETNMRKIRTLQSWLRAHLISQEEYDKLMDRYLNDK